MALAHFFFFDISFFGIYSATLTLGKAARFLFLTITREVLRVIGIRPLHVGLRLSDTQVIHFILQHEPGSQVCVSSYFLIGPSRSRSVAGAMSDISVERTKGSHETETLRYAKETSVTKRASDILV